MKRVSLTLLFFWSFISFSQVGSIIPLKIGETIPDVKFKLVNTGERKTKLSDYKGKLVILDFWATWCVSCLKSLPKVDSLQKKFTNRMQVLLVNSISSGDNKNRIDGFYKKWKSKFPSFNLPSVIDDSVLDAYFPHREVPHYVWISADMKVLAITDSKAINDANISNAINMRPLQLAVKEDFFPNKLLTFNNEDAIIDDHMLHYSLFKMGKIEGLSVNKLRTILNKKGDGIVIRGIAMRNLSLLQMYKEAVNLNQEFRFVYTDRRLILEVNDSSKLIFNPLLTSKPEWEKENWCTYDIVVSENEEDSLYNYVISDLNHYSGFTGKIETKMIKCLALVRTSKTDKIKSKGNKEEVRLDKDDEKKYISNMSVTQFVWRLDRITSMKFPVIDETNYTGNIDLELDVDLGNFHAIRKVLQQYDLDLREVEREIDVFVIREKQK
jgi:thiol-disulfide isomerase/thioredoxin